MAMAAARMFSTTTTSDDSDNENPESKGRFFKFLEKAEKIDERIKESPDEAKRVASDEQIEEPAEIMFDADEIEISLADQMTERKISAELADIDPLQSVLPQEKKAPQPNKKDYELINKAKKRFDRKFFMQFAYEGPDASAFTQRDLEQQFVEMSP